jgi:polyferredoxin
MLADLVLLLHAIFVIFVVAGLAMIWIGLGLGRPFARNRVFRSLHLAAICVVAAESLLGIACPLTVWEDALRGSGDSRGFVARLVHAWMFWDAPAWVFELAYVAFAAAVALTWWRWPPRRG